MAPSSDLIRIGLIGCGQAAIRHHLPIISSLRRFEIAAAADPDPQRLSKVRERIPSASLYSSHEALLAHRPLDAVAVLTPPHTHAALALDVIQAGLPLCLEKPMAPSIEECDRIVDAAKRASTPTLLAHNMRWHPLVIQAKRMIRQGVLGRIRAVQSTYTHASELGSGPLWKRKTSSGGGVLLNEAVHHFDLWRHLLNRPILRIHCESPPDSREFQETCTVTALLEGEIVASGLFSFGTTPSCEIRIFGTKGVLLLSLYHFDGLVLSPRNEVPGSLNERFRRIFRFLASFPEGLRQMRRGGSYAVSFREMWRHFAHCVEGNQEPACTVIDGRAAVAAAAAADLSSRTGSPISMEAKNPSLSGSDPTASGDIG